MPKTNLETLPAEILFNILKYLPFSSLLEVSKVSKKIKNAARDPNLWQWQDFDIECRTAEGIIRLLNLNMFSKLKNFHLVDKDEFDRCNNIYWNEDDEDNGGASDNNFNSNEVEENDEDDSDEGNDSDDVEGNVEDASEGSNDSDDVEGNDEDDNDEGNDEGNDGDIQLTTEEIETILKLLRDRKLPKQRLTMSDRSVPPISVSLKNIEHFQRARYKT